ncbi:MAG: hypothetical protein ACREFP_01300 [Acetobacteraceae bacterium]
MSFEIPEGANVQIIVGKAPVLALPDETIRSHEQQTRDCRAGVRRVGGAALKLLMAMILVGTGLVVGWVAGGHHGEATAALPSGGLPPPPPMAQAFPVRPLSPPQAAPSAQIPPTFTQQLHRPPTVVPPPGQPSAGAPHRNAFGLEN